MATWATTRDLFYSIVGDSAANNYYFTDTQVENFANRALRDIAQETRYLDGSFSVTVPANTSGIKLSNIYNVWRVEADISGASRALIPTTKSRMVREYPGYDAITGATSHYYTDHRRNDADAPVGFFPKPNSDTVMYFYYHKLPDEVDDDMSTEVVDIPVWATLAVLLHMLYQAYRVDTRLQDFNKSLLFKSMYDRILPRISYRVGGKISSGTAPDQSASIFDLDARSNYYVNGTV